MQILSPELGSAKHTVCEPEYPKRNAQDLLLLSLSNNGIPEPPLMLVYLLGLCNSFLEGKVKRLCDSSSITSSCGGCLTITGSRASHKGRPLH